MKTSFFWGLVHRARGSFVALCTRTGLGGTLSTGRGSAVGWPPESGASRHCGRHRLPRPLKHAKTTTTTTTTIATTATSTTTTTTTTTTRRFGGDRSILCVSKTLAVDMESHVERASGAAQRRRERRLRAWQRHVRTAVQLVLAEKLHHSACRTHLLGKEWMGEQANSP